MLVNPSNPGVAQNTIEQSQAAAHRLGLELVVLKAATENEIDSAISTAVQQQAAALSIATDAYFLSRSRQIAFMALRHALPTIGSTREYVTTGILMSYGNNQTDSYRQAVVYVGRILKGDKPADLPVQQSTKVELLLNLKTAKALGITVPLPLSGRADELIE